MNTLLGALYSVEWDIKILKNELERMWKEAVNARVLSRHLPGGIKETHELSQPGKPIFMPGTAQGRFCTMEIVT